MRGEVVRELKRTGRLKKNNRKKENMDALADYSSDDDNNANLKGPDQKRRSGAVKGDNYETVTMDLSEGSDEDTAKESSRGSKESEKNDRVKSGRRHEEEKRERRHHKKHSKGSKDERRDDRDRRDRRDDRHRSDRDRDRKRSRKSRSRSRSPRKHSRSRDRTRDKYHRDRDFKPKKSPAPLEQPAPAPSTAAVKEGSLSPPPYKTPDAIQLSSGIVPGLTNNPTLARIQEQLQKRRALWSNKSAVAKEVPTTSGNNWESTHLPKDNDGKMTAKFKRLMGMKGEVPAAPAAPEKPLTAAEQQRQTDEMFNSMERQYEVARLATHTHRGIGLGFGTFQCNPR